jgi:serine protease Do
VSRVWHDAPAARAGLRRGDIITSVDAQEVPTPAELVEVIAEQEVGARVVIGFVRAGVSRSALLSIADLPVIGRAPERAAPRQAQPMRPARAAQPDAD